MVSIFPLMKLFLIKNKVSLSYQALEAYLRRYKTFVSLNIWLGWEFFSKPGGWWT